MSDTKKYGFLVKPPQMPIQQFSQLSPGPLGITMTDLMHYINQYIDVRARQMYDKLKENQAAESTTTTVVDTSSKNYIKFKDQETGEEWRLLIDDGKPYIQKEGSSKKYPLVSDSGKGGITVVNNIPENKPTLIDDIADSTASEISTKPIPVAPNMDSVIKQILPYIKKEIEKASQEVVLDEVVIDNFEVDSLNIADKTKFTVEGKQVSLEGHTHKQSEITAS